MTSLTLSAVSLNDQHLSLPITARFDAAGGTIGRADHNTMALPDPERFISRVQAEVVATGDGYLIRNVGAANPIEIAGRSLAKGESTAIRDGDAIRLGGYLVRAQMETSAPAVADDTTLGLSAMPEATPPPVAHQPTSHANNANPFADLLGLGAGSPEAPFQDLVGEAVPTPGAVTGTRRRSGNLPPPAGIDPRSASVAQPPASPGPTLPDDFDVFSPAPPPRPDTRSAPASTHDPFADLAGPDGGGSIDRAFGLDRPDADDLLSRFASDASMAQPPNALPPAERDDLPALHGAYQPPAARRLQAAGPTPSVMGPPPSSDVPAEMRASAPVPPVTAPTPAEPNAPDADHGRAESMWRALCDGAGVDLPMPAGAEAEMMRRIGRILRSAIDGTIRLIAVRASTRLEFGAQVTIIRPTDNNPLKFSPDATSGIEQLLRAPSRGFLDGPEAMDDAMRDLVGHSVGSVAGMRAAMEGMFDRFDPTMLEARLGDASLLDSLLPMNRRARLWELYLQHHAAIREAAQDDFQTLFGKAFLAAYEQQVEQLAPQQARRR